tara:strand:+ start:453 stop:713 length:261 start_codon:yes stop_codon:yes gene_type:complete
MNIIQLISIVKKKLRDQIKIETIQVEDKSFLHKNHPGNQIDKFHLKVILKSNELKRMSKVNSSKRVYKILDYEMKNFIHSLQILID